MAGSIFDMFRGQQGAPAQGQQAAPGQPGTGTGAQPQGAAPNGWVPPGVAPTAQGQQPQPAQGAQPAQQGQAPLPDFAKMWQTPALPEGAPKPAGLFNLTPEQINQAASQHSFSRGVAPELVSKALQGDVQAFMQVIDSVGRNIYAQSAFSGTKLIEAGVKNFETRFSADTLPAMLKNHSVDDSLRANNSMFNDPRYSPMLDTFKQAVVRSNPTATTSEINQLAQTYMQTMYEDMKKNFGNNGAGNPGANNQQGGTAAPNVPLVTRDAQGKADWTNFFAPMGAVQPGQQGQPAPQQGTQQGGNFF